MVGGIVDQLIDFSADYQLHFRTNKSRQNHGQLLLVLNTQIYWNVGRQYIQIDRRTLFPST